MPSVTPVREAVLKVRRTNVHASSSFESTVV